MTRRGDEGTAAAPRQSTPRFWRAAVHPVPLALLAAGGVAGAMTSWIAAGVGAVAYAVGVAVTASVRKSGGNGAGAALVPPSTQAVAVRSTEVMALVVRIRKAHQGMYLSLRDGDATVRAVLAPSYERLGALVTHAYGLAKKADAVRAHLDKTPPAATLARQLAGSNGADEALRGQLDARQGLDAQYAEMTAQLARVGAQLESWQGRVLHISADAPGEAEQGSREMLEELDGMEHLVSGLEASMKL